MPSPRGIFRLKQVYEEQLSGNWTVKSDVWLTFPAGLTNFGTGVIATPQTGYFGGGKTGAPTVSTVDRINFANDFLTASPKGPLSAARSYSTATGNGSYGYFGGGGYPTALSTVDRIDYTNDTATASPKGPLSVARAFSAAAGNSNYGW